MELLPPARAALLEAPKRAKYDDFLVKAKSGAAPSDFETFINDLMGFNEQMEEKTGLLATKDKVEPRATVLEVPVNKPAASKPAASSRPATSTPQRPVPTTGAGNAYSTGGPKKATTGGPGGIIGGVGGLVLGVAIGYLALHHFLPAILLGIVFAAVGFVV